MCVRFQAAFGPSARRWHAADVVSPDFHPAVVRVPVGFEPIWADGATAMGAEPSVAQRPIGFCLHRALRTANSAGVGQPSLEC
jgi:hypothetical protein